MRCCWKGVTDVDMICGSEVKLGNAFGTYRESVLDVRMEFAALAKCY